MASRVCGSATRAVSSTVSVPISARTRGLASRLWYQSGFVGAPPLEANTAKPSPTAWYIIGLTRSWPVLAPTVCSSRSGAPSNGPPTLPSLARNSAMILLFQSSGMPGEPGRRAGSFPGAGQQAASERDVPVGAAPRRGLGDRAGHGLPGPGGLDDLVDHAERDRAGEPAGLALVLGRELGLDLVPLPGRRGGQRAPVQDPDRCDRAHHG